MRWAVQSLPRVVFDAWILPSRVVDHIKKVPDLNCGVEDRLLEVVDLEKRGAGSEIRRDPAPPPI